MIKRISCPSPCYNHYEYGNGENVVSDIPVQYITDEKSNKSNLIIPIGLWEESESEHEMAYLLKSNTIKKQLIEAKHRQGGMSFEEVRGKLGN